MKTTLIEGLEDERKEYPLCELKNEAELRALIQECDATLQPCLHCGRPNPHVRYYYRPNYQGQPGKVCPHTMYVECYRSYSKTETTSMPGCGMQTSKMACEDDDDYTDFKDALRMIAFKWNRRPENLAHGLIEAARDGDIEKMATLLDAGADIEGFDGDTPLFCSIGIFKDTEQKTIGFLLERGAYINAKNKRGETPLQRAILYGQPEIAEYLVRQGADLKSSFDVDVVLVGEPDSAVALKWEEKTRVFPRIHYASKDYLGRHILDAAKDKNVPVVECDPHLLQNIFDQKFFSFFAEEHYAALASACASILQNKGLAYDGEKNEFVKIDS